VRQAKGDTINTETCIATPRNRHRGLRAKRLYPTWLRCAPSKVAVGVVLILVVVVVVTIVVLIILATHRVVDKLPIRRCFRIGALILAAAVTYSLVVDK